MGYIKHHAIVITSWNEELIADAHKEALEAFPATMVTPVQEYVINSGGSFAILPDGSKEGWGPSNSMDAARNTLVKWLEAQAYEDGSSSLQWFEAAFAGDEAHDTQIVRAYKGVRDDA